jgi:hypothetical protein
MPKSDDLVFDWGAFREAMVSKWAYCPATGRLLPPHDDLPAGFSVTCGPCSGLRVEDRCPECPRLTSVAHREN